MSVDACIKKCKIIKFSLKHYVNHFVILMFEHDTMNALLESNGGILLHRKKADE